MKEFCLVPRAWVKKVTPQKTITPLAYNNNNRKPDLESLLNVYVKPFNKEYVTSMLTLLNNNESVQWNERGDMLPPFTKINIIDLLKKFALGSGNKLDENILPDVKLLLSVADIPNGYIRNKTIRNQLSQEGGGRGRKRKKLGQWLPYNSRRC